MARVCLALNFNIQHCAIPPEEEEALARLGYEPLLRVLLDHGELKAAIFVTGRTSERLAEMGSEAVDLIKEGIRRGQFELGAYTYAHPIIPRLPYEDAVRQIKTGLEIDERTYGVRPEGLLPPEYAWDPLLPRIMRELGLRWLLLEERVLVKSLEQLADHLGARYETRMLLAHYRVRSLGAEVGCVFGVDLELANAATCGMEIDDFLGKVERYAGAGPGLLTICSDAEFLYGRFRRGKGRVWDERWIRRLDEILKRLERFGSLTISEHLEKGPSGGEIALRSTAWVRHGGEDDYFESWRRGADRLDALCEEARVLIKLAELEGAPAELIERAWRHLMLAENSDARISGWHYPHSRKVEAAIEEALKAIELVRRWLEARKRYKPGRR